MRRPKLIRKIISLAEKYRLFPESGIILLAVSGGPDSMALLHIFHSIFKNSKRTLGVVHFNHGLRGVEADEDESFVKLQASQLNFNFWSNDNKPDIPTLATQNQANLQETARDLRLEFFSSILESQGGGAVALGHNADDQAETVLMNLMRGSGLKGISGMRLRRGHFIRPLLECTRQELLGYLDQEKIPYRLDSSNLNRKYDRNRLRLDVLPGLEKNASFNFAQSIFRTSQLLQADDNYLTQEAEKQFHLIRKKPLIEDEEHLSCSRLVDLPEALLYRILRMATHRIKGNLRRIRYSHIDNLAQLAVKSEEGKHVLLPGQLIGQIFQGFLVIKKQPERKECIQIDEELNRGLVLPVPGEIRIPGTIHNFRSEILNSRETEFRKAGPSECFLDFEKIKVPLKIRFFREGDRFWPLGSKGSKKLKSFLIDQKIPQEDRKNIPLVTSSEDEIVWVKGIRIGEPFKIQRDTRNILHIECLHTGGFEGGESS